MKKIILLTLFCLFTFSFISFSQSTLGCDGRRYLQDIFTDTTKTTVKYGKNATLTGLETDLYMDIIQPKGDELAKRPVIVWAFGGGFIQGSRADMLPICYNYAKKGYINISIDYRLYSVLALGFPDSVKITPAVIQASQDMKAAIRYLYKDAKTTNTFKIDTNNIIIGGVSAGAITAMSAAQLDSTDKIETWVRNIIAAQGGFEGKSGNDGYSTTIKGVINLSGALYSKDWLDKNDVPFISYHGTKDNIVAYGYGKNVYNFYSDGGGSLYQKARELGIPSVLVSVPNGGHEDIYDPNGKYTTYLNDIASRITVFSKQLVCGETINSLSTNIQDIDIQDIKAYPNPASEEMIFDFSKNMKILRGGIN